MSQPDQSFPQATFAFTSQRLLLGAGRILAGQGGRERLLAMVAGGVKRNRDFPLAPAPPTPSIAGLVYRNAINPGFQSSVPTKAINALKRSQESLLGQVARLFHVRRQTVQ